MATAELESDANELWRCYTNPGFDRVFPVSPTLAAELFLMAKAIGPMTTCHALEYALNALSRNGKDYGMVTVTPNSSLWRVHINALEAYLKARGQEKGEEVLIRALHCLEGSLYITAAQTDPPVSEDYVYEWFDKLSFG